LKDDSEDKESIQMRGLTLFRLGRPADAIPLLESAHDWTSQTRVDPSYVLALCYLDTRNYDSARRAFATQYGFPPDSAPAYLLAARMLLRREYLPVAQQFATKALELDPKLLAAHVALAKALETVGQPDQAQRWAQGLRRLQGELEWRRPSRAMLQNMLRNPAYAGIYAYGRSAGDPRRRKPERPFSGRTRVERGQWLVFLPGIYPSYISAEQYEANMRRVDANRSRAQGMGAVRDGPALLAGLVRCGRCGRKMTVRYQRGPGGVLQPSYTCGMAAATWAEDRCQQLSGTCVNEYVSGLALQAMAPAALEISLAAAEQEEDRRAGIDRIWRQRLERADYAADRARRQYQLAEPENRLVVRQLEKDWNEALAERQRLGEDYDRHLAARPRALTAAERDQIRALAAGLPAVWHAETTTDADRKQLLRHLIENVTVTVIGDSEQVNVEVTWAGGHRTTGRVVRPVAALAQLSYLPRLRQRAEELLAAGRTSAQIADALNAEGLRPPKRTAVFTKNAVHDLLIALGLHRSRIPSRHPDLGEGEWWLRDLAEHLGMSKITLDAWVRRGWADGYLHPEARLIVVRADPAETERLRARHETPRGQYMRRPWQQNQEASTSSETEGSPRDDDRTRL